MAVAIVIVIVVVEGFTVGKEQHSGGSEAEIRESFHIGGSVLASLDYLVVSVVVVVVFCSMTGSGVATDVLTMTLLATKASPT